MPAGPHPADSVNHFVLDLGIPRDSISSGSALRNTLLHGELQPHEQAFAAYEPAYRIVMRFLNCVRN